MKTGNAADNTIGKLLLAGLFVWAGYSFYKQSVVDSFNASHPPQDANAFLADIPPELPEETQHTDLQVVLGEDEIADKLIEELRKCCSNPELFSVVNVSTGLTDQASGRPAVEVKYITANEFGERVNRLIGAVLNPDGSVFDVRYHLEQEK